MKPVDSRRLWVIDAGNTRMKFGEFADARPVRVDSCAYPKLEEHLAALDRNRVVACDSILVSNVGPLSEDALVRAFRRHGFSARPRFLRSGDPRRSLPVRIDYEDPATLGSDRLGAAVGAVALYPDRDRVLFDFGTATTVGFVDRRGTFLGGAIAPGISLSARALASATAGLPERLFTRVLRPTARNRGRSTPSAIESGVRMATAGLVREALDAARTLFRAGADDPAPLAIATGGHLALLDDSFPFDRRVPHLTLFGLAHAARETSPIPHFSEATERTY